MDAVAPGHGKDNKNLKKKPAVRRSKRKPTEQTDIARERIGILFSLAEKEFGNEPALSDRYVELARRISKKFNVPIAPEFKRRFCRKCGKYLMVGENASAAIDARTGCLSIKCLGCGEVRLTRNTVTENK